MGTGEKVYKNPGAIGSIVGVFFSQLGPFFGIFFGTKGPDGEWPHAWWSFCFLGNAFGSLGWFAPSQVYKIIRTPTTLVTKNIFGGSIMTIPLESIEDLQSGSNCCGKYISVKVTDAFYEEQKKKAGCCKCCVSKSMCLCLCGSDHAAFLQDHGLQGSGTVVGKYDA